MAIKSNHQKILYQVTVPQYFWKIVPLPVSTILFSNRYRYYYCGTLRKYYAHLFRCKLAANQLTVNIRVKAGIYLKGMADYHCYLFSSRMSNVQIFGLISDQNALFLMKRGGVGQIIFVVFLLVNSLEL